ncbi:unnamed protein product [Closterium sp. NIES-65]|nr:unnamed protein product [Closterium sp. NIES-65]
MSKFTPPLPPFSPAVSSLPFPPFLPSVFPIPSPFLRAAAHLPHSISPPSPGCPSLSVFRGAESVAGGRLDDVQLLRGAALLPHPHYPPPFPRCPPFSPALPPSPSRLVQKVLLVGDSMMSNFYEALLCAIHIGGFKGEPYQRNTGGVFNVKGVRFPRMGISIEHLFSPYLVYAITRGAQTANAKGGHGYDVHVDKIHPTVAKILPEYAMAVFASGVWWQQNVPRRKQPNVFFVNNSPKNLSNLDAHAWALNTLSSYLKTSNYGGVPYFISFSPHHSGMGNPQNGVYQGTSAGGKPAWVGACGAVKPMSEQLAIKDYSLSLPTSEAYMTTQKTALMGSTLRFLQVTSLSAMRPDAHQGPWFKRRPSSGPGSPAGNGESPFSGDCTHWCLPGVPDAWVDMMYANMLREPSLAGKKF